MTRTGLKSYIGGVFFLIFATFLFAQETYNLEIIWQKVSPESVFYYGRCIASGDVNGDSFSDIMIVGDSVIESPPHSDSCYRGKCWIFYGGVNFDTISDIWLLNLQKLTFWSLHSSDINGDGFDDVILGACNNGETGQVLVFLGGNPMDTICDFKMRGPSRGSVFGCAVSSGDVNGDGYSDLIVGAYGAAPMPGGYDMGQVYIYYGGPNIDTIPDVILNGGHNNDHEAFGSAVSGSGDFNDDGFSDIIIGAMNFNHDRGRIYIYGGGNPMDTIYDVAMTGEGFLSGLGECGVDLLFNANDFSHAVAGAPGYFQPGLVYVLYGGNPMDSIPDLKMIGRTSRSLLGTATSSAGNVTGEGFEAVIASAINDPPNYFGTAYLWLGGITFDTIPDAWIRGVQGINDVGQEVASAGDVDGDGKDEIMVCNSSSMYPTKVWICKYTGQGIEERSTQNAERLTLEVNPNPARSVIRVRYPWSDKGRRLIQAIKIFDVSGKLIREISTNTSAQEHKEEMKISLKGINPGIYFLQLGTTVRKFLVVR